MDIDFLVFSLHGKPVWCFMGLCRIGLGRLLGLGPRGKCGLHAFINCDRFFAFRNDPGKKGHDESLEHVFDPSYFCDDHFWYIYHT